jgi:HEAT repeat protein
MRALRLLGFALSLGGMAMLADVSAQNPPGVKTQPQIKPGEKGVAPGGGVGVKPGEGKKIPPGGGVMPGGNPGVGNPGVGNPGVGGPGAMPKAPLPATPGNWPKEIGGKKLDFYVKELKSNPDAANREQCARVIPLFGPDAASIAASENIIWAMTKDVDTNVRIAALQAVPLMGFSDTYADPGMAAIATMLSSDQFMTQYEATVALGRIGPYAGKLSSKVAPRATTSVSWQMRRAACFTLGQIGRAVPAMMIEQEPVAVTTLLRVLREDKSAQVKREAATALIAIGPTAIKEWKITLENVVKSEVEKDRTTKLLCRVCLVKNDPAGAKPNDPHIAAIAGVLLNDDPLARADALQALGLLGDTAASKINDVLTVMGDVNEATKNPNVVVAAVMAAAAMPSQAAISIPALQKLQVTATNPDIKNAATQAVSLLSAPP